MDQNSDDYREQGNRPFRLPPAWVLTLLAMFAIGLVIILADLAAVAAKRTP